MVSHAQLQDGLVDPQSWGVEYEVLGKKNDKVLDNRCEQITEVFYLIVT